MADVKQTITGDSASAQKAYADLARQVVKLEEANQRMANKMDVGMKNNGSAQARMNSLVKQGAGAVAGMAIQWASLTTVISAATAQVEEYKRVTADAADTQISVGDAQAELIKNMASSSTPEKKAFIERIARMQQETKFQNLPHMYLAAAEGSSASAGNIPATESALRAAIPLARHKPEDLKVMVGAALDLAKASGETDAEKNLGFLMQVGEQSRVQGLRNTSLNVASAVATSAKTVTSDPKRATIEAGALFAALSNEGVEPTGETTAHAERVFTGELRSFFQEGVKVNVPGRSRPILVKPKEDPNTIEGRIRVLQEDPRLAKAFMQSANFGRERFRIPFEQLINKGQTDQAFRAALKKLSLDAGAYKQIVSELDNLTPQIALSNVRKEGESNTQQFENLSSLEGIRAEATKIRDEAVVKTRKYGWGRLGFGFLAEATNLNLDDMLLSDADATEYATEQLRARQDQIRYAKRSIMGTREYGDPRRDYSQLAPQEQKDFDYLGRQIETLNTLLKQQLRIQEEMNARDKEKRPSAGPAARMEAGRHHE